MQAPLKNSPGATGAQVNPLTDPMCAGFLAHHDGPDGARCYGTFQALEVLRGR